MIDEMVVIIELILVLRDARIRIMFNEMSVEVG